jgi:hypothetical protein
MIYPEHILQKMYTILSKISNYYINCKVSIINNENVKNFIENNPNTKYDYNIWIMNIYTYFNMLKIKNETVITMKKEEEKKEEEKKEDVDENAEE